MENKKKQNKIHCALQHYHVSILLILFLVFENLEYICMGRSKSPNLERRIIADYFCCGITLSLLEKLIQIPDLIAVQERLIQKWTLHNECKIWMRPITFWTTLYVCVCVCVCVYIYIYIYIYYWVAIVCIFKWIVGWLVFMAYQPL